MRTTGYIFTIFGVIAFIGSISGNTSPFGPLFWIALGVFLIYRSKAKTKSTKDINDWNNN